MCPVPYGFALALMHPDGTVTDESYYAEIVVYEDLLPWIEDLPRLDSLTICETHQLGNREHSRSVPELHNTNQAAQRLLVMLLAKPARLAHSARDWTQVRNDFASAVSPASLNWESKRSTSGSGNSGKQLLCDCTSYRPSADST